MASIVSYMMTLIVVRRQFGKVLGSYNFELKEKIEKACLQSNVITFV